MGEEILSDMNNSRKTAGSRENPNKGMWKNKVEYILSLAGYTTGSSDFWRFPYLIWTHGGGTFIVAYVISAVIIAIPVYYLEVAVSQFSGRGMFDVWDIAPIMKGLGIGMFIINVESILITPVFRLWIMEYIGYSLMSPLPWKRCDNPWNTPACVDLYRSPSTIINATLNGSQTGSSTFNVTSVVLETRVLAEEEFFLHKVLQISGSLFELETLRWDLCLCLLIFICICSACVVKSVESVGKAMYVFTILPLVLLIIVWIRTLIAPGAVAGMQHFLTPEFSKFGSLQLWVQAGFTAASAICTATGGIMEMGSRAHFRTNVFSASVIPCMIDIFGSIFTSMVVYSVIGVMAHESGMELGDTLFSGHSAAFVAFSRAFSFFPLPNLWLVLFFLAFLIATSDIMVCYFEILNRCLPKLVSCLDNRPKTTFVTVLAITFLANLPMCTQAGGYIFQILAWYYATWGILVMTALECVIFMWIYGGHLLDENIKLMNGTKMPHIIRFTTAFVCPVLSIVLLVIGISRYKSPVFGTYHYPSSVEVIGFLISILPLIPLVYWILLSLYRNRRTAFTKKGLYELFQPSMLWGPRDQNVFHEYKEAAAKQRSWSQTAYYNLTGRQRTITRQETCEQPCVMTEML